MADSSRYVRDQCVDVNFAQDHALRPPSHSDPLGWFPGCDTVDYMISLHAFKVVNSYILKSKVDPSTEKI